jgi:hypothetical protein
MSNSRTLNNFTLSDITGNSVFEGGYLTISLIPQLDDTFTLGAAAKRWNNIYSSGICRLSGTTASTSTSTGTLICSGGVGIAGSLYVGGTINLAAVICTTLTASGLITAQAGVTITGALSCTTAATLCSASGTCTIGATNAVTITTAGVVTIPSTAARSVMHGAVYSGSVGYNSLGNSQLMICGTYTYGAADHASQLVLLDNSSTATNGGNCGALVFAGPAHNFGSSQYMAAGRIRAANGSSAFYGTMYLETLTTGGNLTTAITLNNDQTTTFAAGITGTTAAMTGLISGSAGLTISAGSTSLQATTTTTLGCTTLTASGLITGSSGLTISSGSTSLQATTTTTLGCTTLTASGLVTCNSAFIGTSASTFQGTGDTTAAIATIFVNPSATTATGSSSSQYYFTNFTSPILTKGSSHTCTLAASVYIAGAVTAGGSVSITNNYALYVAAGATSLQGTTTTTLTASGLVTAQAGVTITTGQTLNVGTSGTTSPANIYGDLTVGASANSTNAKNVITSHGYFTNKTPSASYSNGSIVLVNNYTTSLSASTPAMQGIMFTSNTRPSQVTWSTVMGYASSLTVNHENCGILWCTANDGTLDERMRMDNTGCLSIGNTTASGMLNVGSSTAFTVSTAGVVTVNNTTETNLNSYVGAMIIKGGCFVEKQLCSNSTFGALPITYNVDTDRTILSTDLKGVGIYYRASLTGTRTDTIDTKSSFGTQLGTNAVIYVLYVNNSTQNIVLKASTGWNNFIGAQFTAATAINGIGTTIAVGTGFTIAKQQTVLLILDVNGGNIYVK